MMYNIISANVADIWRMKQRHELVPSWENKLFRFVTPFVRYSLYHAWEENIACKKVKSIKKLGFEAMHHLFGPKGNLYGEYFRAYSEREDTSDLDSLAINTPSFNLEGLGKNECTEGDRTFRGGTEYFIWSIAGGLIKLPSDSKPIFYEITKAIKELKEVPSHLLVREWESINGKLKSESYQVFSLSQDQQTLIKNALS